MLVSFLLHLPFRQCWKLIDSAQLLFSGLRQHVENAKSQMGFITGSRVSFSFFKMLTNCAKLYKKYYLKLELCKYYNNLNKGIRY